LLSFWVTVTGSDVPARSWSRTVVTIAKFQGRATSPGIKIITDRAGAAEHNSGIRHATRQMIIVLNKYIATTT
jgi:hypothetical protein